MIRRILAVTAASAVLLYAGIVARAGDLDQQRADAVVELRALASEARSAAQRADRLEGAIERAEQDTADRAAVLEVRPGFVAELTALSAAIGGAEGKVDMTTHLASALSAQQAVLAENANPDTVASATATIRAITEAIGSEVSSSAAIQSSPSAGPGGPAYTTSGPDGYARVRAALDRVGGGEIGLYESSSCAGGNAPACANSNGYIKYRADIATWNEGRLNWAMAHELAHIYQFRVWTTLTSSSAYGSLFGSDPEFLANCMAVVRGYPGSVGCNGDQRAWASGIWVGAVR